MNKFEKIFIALDPKNTGTTPAIKESFKRVMSSALSNLGVDFYIIYDQFEIIDAHDSLVIFIASPKRVYKSIELFVKNNNTFVVWNFEPLSIVPETRAWNFMHMMTNVCNDESIDHIWHFAENQINIIKSEKISYMPFGFEASISCGNYTKTNDVIFLGEPSPYRDGVLPAVNGGSFNYYNHTSSDYNGMDEMLRTISSFRIGIDCMAEDNTPDYIRWHRVMLYAANNVALITDNNLLAEYGFSDGQHFFKYIKNDRVSLVSAIRKIVSDHQLLSNVATNMINKIKSDFSMTSLIADKLKSLHFS